MNGGRTSWEQLHYSFEIGFHLQNFEEYADYIESSFRTELSRYEIMAKEYENPEDLEAFWDHYHDQVHLYNKDFPSLLRSSLLMSIYGFAENRIVAFCSPTGNLGESGRAFKPKKDRKSVIQNAQDYLVNELDRRELRDLDGWEFLNNARKIRNSFVHDGGKASESLKEAITSIDFVEVNEQSNIILDQEYCKMLIDILYTFFPPFYRMSEENVILR